MVSVLTPNNYKLEMRGPVSVLAQRCAIGNRVCNANDQPRDGFNGLLHTKQHK